MYFRDGADFVLKLTPEMEVTDVLANLRSTDVPKAVKAAVTLSRSFLARLACKLEPKLTFYLCSSPVL